MDDHQAGLQSAVISIANAQAMGGHSVSLASSTSAADTHDSLATLDRRVSVYLFERSRWTGRLNGSPGMRRWVRRAVSSHDVVHVHSIWSIPTYMTSLYAVLRGRRLVISPHGSLDPFDVRKHARLKRILGPVFLRPVLTRAQVVHCTAEREARDLVTYGAKVRTLVAKLPINTSHLSSTSGARLREKYGLSPDAPLILFLGRIDYKKGLTYLLQALALVPEPRPFLLVAGRGAATYETLVRDLVIELGLSREVIFAGWLTGQDKATALSGADLFVLLSDNENYGISVMEAVQAELPVILTQEVYIAADLVAAGAAVLSTQDPREAATRIQKVLGDEALRSRMKAAARTYAASSLSYADIAQQYSDLLASS